MSPAIVDNGVPSHVEARIFNSLCRFDGGSCSLAYIAGFMDPKFGSSKPAAGLSRPPRMAKLRKSSVGGGGSCRPISQMGVGVSSGTGIDPRFGRADSAVLGPGLRNAGRDSGLFGGNVVNIDVERAEAMEEMRRLRIESETASAAVGELGDEIRRLHFDGKNFSSENLNDLPNKMKKLNVKSFELDDSDNILKDASAALPNRLRNLKMDDSLNEKVDDGNSSARHNSLNAAAKSSNATESGANLRFDFKPMHELQDKKNLGGVSVSGFTFQATSSESKIRGSSTSSPLFGSSGLHFEPPGTVPEIPSVNAVDSNSGFMFTTKLDHAFSTGMEFKTPDPKAPLVFGLNRKMEAKKESTKDNALKKKKGKWRKPTQVPVKFPQSFVSRESVPENSESPEQYSPMDISPYEETFGNPSVNVSSFSRETSVASEESFNIEDDKIQPNSTDEVLMRLYPVEDTNRDDSPDEDAVSGVETESFKSATDELDYGSESFVTAPDTSANLSSEFKEQDGDAVQHSFTFTASSSSFDEPSGSIRLQKKNHRNKVFGHRSSSKSSLKVSSALSQLPSFQDSGSAPVLSVHDKKSDSLQFSSQNQKAEYEKQKEQMIRRDSETAASISAQESCEKWRLRGNQAYAKGDFLKAEDCYSLGISCISQLEASRSCLRALMLCFSNRAATRMSLGRFREALDDCNRACELDLNFLKAQVRAASCYLALGEVENATMHFKKCLQQSGDISADKKLLIEASEGLEKAKKLAECMKLASELLGKGTSGSIDSAIGIISEGLIISSYSEHLLRMKAEALFMLKKYEESIHLCERILGYAESNFPSSGSGNLFNGPEDNKFPSFRIWCLSLALKSYFYMGKLEEALIFLKNQEDSFSNIERQNRNLESLIPLIGIIRELLHHKGAGNEAYKAGKNTEAVEHYTSAITCSVESRPFTAICFCNRAAAYGAMGQTLDAIADCSISIALDGNYYKAVSRRASLYEMIRDYEQAAADIRKFVSLIEKEEDQKMNQGDLHDAVDYSNELLRAQVRLTKMEEADMNEIPLNFYLILGVDPSSGAPEIKKAYRKAALKYHPDKAGQSLSRNETSDDTSWKEIMDAVRRDADKLFKMMGEAYAVLSDPAKRSQFDLEEEIRNSMNNRGISNAYGDPRRRYWQESWRSSSYGASPRTASQSHW